MRRVGHSVSVLCAESIDSGNRNEVLFRDEPYDGIPVRRLYFNWLKADDPQGAFYVRNPAVGHIVAESIRELKPDVIHITSCVYLSASAVTAACQSGVPVALTLTDFWFVCPRTSLLRSDQSLCDGRKDGLTCQHCLYGRTRTYRFLRTLPPRWRASVLRLTRRSPSFSRQSGSLNLIHAVDARNEVFGKLLNEVDCIISPSRFLRGIFVASGILTEDKIIYSPHGHKVELASAGKHKTPSDLIRFGFTGNMIHYKGVDVLIAAFNKLERDGLACLNLYGEAEAIFGQRLRSLASGNPAIHFHGPYQHTDLGKVLADIDVVVVPSVLYENAPLTIAEAFCADTPVIATDLGGMAEAVQHNLNGLLFRRGDAEDLACQMRRIIDEPGLLEQLKRGIPSVKTVGQEARNLEKLYKELRQHPSTTALSMTG